MKGSAHLVAVSRRSGREWESVATLYNVSIAETAAWKRSSKGDSIESLALILGCNEGVMDISLRQGVLGKWM